MLRAYANVLGPRRLWAALVVAALVAGGMLEGVAFLALIPILEQTIGNIGGVSVVNKTLAALGVKGDLDIAVMVWSFFAIVSLSAVLTFLGERGVLWLRLGVEKALRGHMSEALTQAGWNHYLSQRVGELGKVILQETHYVVFGMGNYLQGLAAVALIPFFLLLTLVISVKMTLLALCFGVLLFGVYRLVGQLASRWSKAYSKHGDLMSDTANQVFGNMKFFRASALTGRALKDLDGLYEKVRQSGFATYAYSPLNKLVYQVGGALFVTFYLYLLLVRREQPLADGLVFLVIFQRVTPRIFTANESLHQGRIQLPWYDSFWNRLETLRHHQDDHRGTTPPTFGQGLTVDGVTHCYREGAAPAVKDVTFTLDKGGFVALVGQSGSGKSTVLDLIAGLFSPSSGAVKVDGVPLRETNRTQWQTHLGVLLQDSPIFHTSVLNNIAWGADTVDREKARRCAELANAWGFIQDLPEGLDADVGEGGGRLSGGQRQRLALARALYRDPWLLLLDEATSALDAPSEKVIQEALASLKGKVTILLVTHRLSITQIADRVLVMEKGRVVEEGSWGELTAKSGGPFQQMLALQERREGSP